MISHLVRKVATSVLLIAALPFAAQAQCVDGDVLSLLSVEQRTALQTQVDETVFNRGLYWQAEKDGTTLSLFGTMHLADPRHARQIERISPDLLNADLLLVESTLDDQKAMQIHMANNPDLITLTSGPSLPEMLDNETWQTLREAAQARGIPGFIAAKMQPWFLALNLAIPPCAMAAMVSGELGLDAMIMTLAQDNALPIAPLEPWEDMFGLLSAGTQEEQLEDLRLSAIDPAILDALLTTSINSYFEESTALAWHLSSQLQPFIPGISAEDYAAEIADLEETLLKARNHDWIPVIEDAATQHDNIFIAFGAAHLIGEDGVLNLLQNNGWVISPH